MKELDEIDRLFQTTFEEFELTPDPTVKANIDRAIASRKKKRRFLFILFPVLFGTALAAILYTHSFSGKLAADKPATSQNPFSHHAKKTNSSSNKLITHTENEQTIQFTEKQETSSLFKSRIKRKRFENRSSVETKATSHSKNNFASAVNSRPVLSHVQILVPAETKISVRSDESLARTEDQADESVEQNTHEKKAQDSTTTALQADSLSNEITETVEAPSPPKVEKIPAKWSLAIVTGWENEKKRAAENFDTTTFSGPREFALIHTTSFYAKIEVNRKLSKRFDAIAGLGFRSSSVKQNGTLYSRDSFLTIEGVGSVPSLDSFSYFIKKQNGALSYQVNSILLPLGLSFSTPLSQRFNFRLSGGTEFAFGWIANKPSHPNLSSARFRPFGWNVWLRPEIHYTFRKLQLFGFGSFNQPLYQQLKWDFKPRRNPLFGAGIGLLIRL